MANQDPIEKLRALRANLKSKESNNQVATSVEKPKNPGYKYYDPSTKTGEQSDSGFNVPFKAPVQVKKPVQTQQEQPRPNKSFLRNIADGLKVETPRMLGNMAQGTAELADMAPTLFATAPTIGEVYATNPNARKAEDFGKEYKKELEKQEKGESTPALQGFREFAKRKYEKAEAITEEIKPDPESWGYMVGSLAPQGLGIATAVGVGAFNPPVGMALGMANMGGLTMMAGGAAAKEYDDYVAEKGMEPNPNEKLGAMILSMTAEGASEAIPVAKFIPKGFRGKMGKFIFGNTEVMSKRGATLLEEFANTNNSRKQLVKNVLASVGEGALTEGPTEAFAELGVEFSTWLYKEKKDRSTWQEMAERSVKAAAGGAILGGAIGPMSYGAQQVQNQRRRKEAGKVIIAQDKESGEAVEIMGMANAQKDGSPPTDTAIIYQAIRPNGKIVEIDENQLDGIIDLPTADFEGLLKGKGKALQEQTNQQNEQKAAEAQQQSNDIRNQYQEMAYQDENGQILISGAKFNGEEVFVTAMMPNGSAVIQKPGEDKKVVRQEGLTDIDTRPFEDFLQTFGPTAEQLQPAVTTNPIQKGEEVDIEGQKYVVTGFDLESGMVQLENMEDPSDLPPIPVEEFEQFRSQAPQVEAQVNPAAEQLREIFAPKEEITKEQQQKLDANKKVSEIMPGLGGENQVENEILGKNEQPTAKTETKPDDVQEQPAKSELGGKEPIAPENVPQKPDGEGVDGKVQVEKPLSRTQQDLVNKLPKKKVNYKDIKGIGDLSMYLNNPDALDQPYLKSAKKIYEDLKNGKPINDTPSLNDKNELMDGQNRIAAQLAFGIEDIDVAIIDRSFYDNQNQPKMNYSKPNRSNKQDKMMSKVKKTKKTAPHKKKDKKGWFKGSE